MTDGTNRLTGSVFLVDEKPYCLWDFGTISNNSLQFLSRIDPSYFEYQARIHYRYFHYKKYKQDAALALRVAYSHGLETLFSLICASIQAPYCVHGWLLKCTNLDLYNLVKKINQEIPFPNLLIENKANWETISKALLVYFSPNNKELESIIKKKFEEIWRKWAYDFINDEFQNEYNSIKHGFRIKKGGFSLSFAKETTPGIPAPADQMVLLGTSEYGSMFIDENLIDDRKRQFSVNTVLRNWSPDDMAWSLKLISMSITNVIANLKIINGNTHDKIRFVYPRNIHIFDEPNKGTLSLGATSLKTWGPRLTKENIPDITKEQMRSSYDERKYVLHL